MAATAVPATDRPVAGSRPGEVADRVGGLVVALDREVAALDLDDCGPQEAVALLAAFARIRRAGAAGEALAARRVARTGAHEGSGHRSAAHLVAAVGGTDLTHAQMVVDTAARLEACAPVEAALRAGEVSVEQAAAVSEAAEIDPPAGAELLAAAATTSVRGLRDRARDLRLAAETDRLGRARAQHAARSLIHGRDRDGMIWGRFRLPPALGVAVVTRLERQADREYRAKDRAARRERHDRHLADALVALVTRRGRADHPDAEHPDADRPSTDHPGAEHASTDAAGARIESAARHADVVVHVAWEALRRGHLEPGELCTVPGGGPVPLEAARELVDGDAFLKGVLVDGADVLRVRHFGRRRPAALQTALETREMLTRGDVGCSVEGCDQRLGLEWDHELPFAAGGPTSYDNVRPLCRPHHRAKSDQDRRSATPGPDPP